MTERRRVGLVLELDQAYKRHYQVLAGVQKYAQQHAEWDCTIEMFPEQPAGSAPLMPAFDGIIARATPELADYTRRAGIPMVNVMFSSSFPGVPVVAPDFEAASRMAGEHLVARGFRHFGFLGSRQKVTPLQIAGFKSALAAGGFDPSVLVVARGIDKTPAEWRRFCSRMDKWIDTWTTPIGVVASDDSIGRFVATACRRKGIGVPRDAAVIGTCNEPIICEHLEPALSSVDLGYDRVGYRAAEILEAMMAGEPGPTEPVIIEPTGLVARESTDVLAVEDPLTAAALRFIAEHSHERIRVGDVAMAVHATRRTLERRFGEALGRSPAQEIARLRVERAKRMLVESNRSIKRLAADVGFRDATQLSVVFKRVTGVNPSDYRRRRRRR